MASGFEVVASTPGEFARAPGQSDLAKFEDVVKQSGAKLD